MTTYTSRTIPTTTYTGRPGISGFQSYTWDNSPDDWATAIGDWDSYGYISTGTVYTARIIPT